MSIAKHITTSLFTALPAGLYFALVITDEGMRQEYYWISILAGVSALFGSALVLGFLQPAWLRPKWFWMLLAGFMALLLALLVTAVVNATPLCVGQDNGDGNNDLGRCMGYVLLYAIFYGIPYMLMLSVSAVTGHWVMKLFR